MRCLQPYGLHLLGLHNRFPRSAWPKLLVRRASQGHSKWITSIAWEPAHLALPSRRFVTGSKDASIRVWDAVTRQTLFSMSSHTLAVSCVKWGGDGLVYSASKDCTINVWSGAVRTLARHELSSPALPPVRQPYCRRAAVCRYPAQGSDAAYLQVLKPDSIFDMCHAHRRAAVGRTAKWCGHCGAMGTGSMPSRCPPSTRCAPVPSTTTAARQPTCRQPNRYARIVLSHCCCVLVGCAAVLVMQHD